MLHFEWDEQKAIQNEQKHHVSFSETKSVFYDPSAILIAKRSERKGTVRWSLFRASAGNVR